MFEVGWEGDGGEGGPGVGGKGKGEGGMVEWDEKLFGGGGRWSGVGKGLLGMERLGWEGRCGCT